MLQNDDCPKAQRAVLYLPRTMDTWPWPRVINPHYEEVSAASNDWFHRFRAFSARSQYAFDKCDLGLLTALAYPTASKERLRSACDVMNLFFLIDEYTDVETAPAVREMADAVIGAFQSPHEPRPEGEILLGQVAKEFWESAIKTATKTATPSSQKHFVEAFIDYLESVVAQAKDRDSMSTPTVHEYLETRRQNIGIRPAFAIAELHLSLPDDTFYHPIIKELEFLSADLVFLDNDIVSYNKEQANGDDQHNILTVVMNQFHIDLEEAMNWVASYHDEVKTKFINLLKSVPTWGPGVDEGMAEYIEHVANWPTANYYWSFECGRFFGSKGLEIEQTRYVPLLPKTKEPDAKHKREQVVVQLVEL